MLKPSAGRARVNQKNLFVGQIIGIKIHIRVKPKMGPSCDWSKLSTVIEAPSNLGFRLTTKGFFHF